MGYYLGVDLGTTYTAAAIARDGRVEITELGNRTPTVPSVVFLTEDETMLTGEAANRRAVGDPGRVAREFKRRIGDTTPLMLGGSPYSADALSARMLRWVVDTVTEREGAAPDGVAVAYPANWGPFKRDLLGQAIRQADLDGVETITEPEAAVVHYAAQERVETGSIIAVYDLGGGTFDSAIVRKTADGVEVLGEPEGIERLGGVDFDEAVFRHVATSLGNSLAELDPDDPVAMAAVARLRVDCVEAKEALSSDTEVSIPVLLPNIQTEVRLTRAELEAMIRPPLANSMGAMRRAVRAAGITEADLTAVLLVGGSSRIPLVAQMVGAELGRPVAVDAHPKHAVALGAAQYAATKGTGVAPAPAAAPPAAPVAAPPPADVVTMAPAPPPPAPTPPPPPADPPPVAAPPQQPVDPTPPAPAAPAPPAAAPPAAPPPQRPDPAPAAGGPSSAGPPPPGYDNALAGKSAGKGGRVAAIVVGVLVVIALIGGGIALFGGGDDGDGDDDVAADSTDTGGDDDTGEDTGGDGDEGDLGDDGGTTTTTTTTDPPDEEPCIAAGPDDRCIEIDAISVNADGLLEIEWTAVNYEPALPNGEHAHFYWDHFDSNQVGSRAAEDFGAEPGVWHVTATRPATLPADGEPNSPGPRDDAEQICVTPADGGHGVIDPAFFDCIDIPEDFTG